MTVYLKNFFILVLLAQPILARATTFLNGCSIVETETDFNNYYDQINNEVLRNLSRLTDQTVTEIRFRESQDHFFQLEYKTQDQWKILRNFAGDTTIVAKVNTPKPTMEIGTYIDEENFKKQKFATLFTLYAIRQHPEVERIRMIYIDENAEVFFAKLYSKTIDDVRKMVKSDYQEARQKFLNEHPSREEQIKLLSEAFLFAAPSGRALAHAGWLNVKSVLYAATSINVDLEKGLPNLENIESYTIF